MSFTLALLGSMLVHLGILFGPEWELPSLNGSDPPAVVEAVLLPAAKADVVAPRPIAAKPAPSRLRPTKPVLRPSTVPPVATSTADVPSASVPPEPTFDPGLAPESEPAPLAAAEPVPPPPPPPPPPPVVPTAPQAITLPTKGRISYDLTRGEQGFIIGRTIQEWEHDGLHYKANGVTETTGLAALIKSVRVLQSSRGRISAAGLQPEEFRHEKVKGTDVADFDWERKLLRYDGKEVALPAGTQDMLSLYFQATLTAVPDQVLELPIATGRKLERYRFEPKGEERLTVLHKEWLTWRYAAKSGGDLIEIWIAPELRGLPLKMRFVDRKGELFDQIAVAIDIKETP
jgi:hypothetical protein